MQCKTMKLSPELIATLRDFKRDTSPVFNDDSWKHLVGVFRQHVFDENRRLINEHPNDYQEKIVTFKFMVNHAPMFDEALVPKLLQESIGCPPEYYKYFKFTSKENLDKKNVDMRISCSVPDFRLVTNTLLALIDDTASSKETESNEGEEEEEEEGSSDEESIEPPKKRQRSARVAAKFGNKPIVKSFIESTCKKAKDVGMIPLISFYLLFKAWHVSLQKYEAVETMSYEEFIDIIRVFIPEHIKSFSQKGPSTKNCNMFIVNFTCKVPGIPIQPDPAMKHLCNWVVSGENQKRKPKS